MLDFQDKAIFEFRTWKVRGDKKLKSLEVNDFALRLLERFK